MSNSVTWIVVADGAHATIYANQGRGRGIDQPAVHEYAGDNSPTREINSDRPGRMAASSSGAQHAMDPSTDAHRHAQQMLARDVAHTLDRAAADGTYAQLVLVAPPRMLGYLRESVSPQVHALLVGDLNKDLTALPVGELATRLREIVKL